MQTKISKTKNQLDMTIGSLWKKQLRFLIPLILTGQLQLLYGAFDIIVVGKYASPTALPAVGSTSSLVNLLLNVFIGLSVGTNVIMSLYFGSKDEDNMQKTLHTSLATAMISGLFLIFIGISATPSILRLMDTPSDVIDQSILYLRILSIGMPFNLIYNFAAAALRAIGDTKRPLIFLSISGIINVILNLVFVIIFHLDVAGVAIATIISQGISAVLILSYMSRCEGGIKFAVKKLRIHKEHFKKIINIGLPAGIQGSFFSLSNVLIQSSINGFGSIAMAGNTASQSLESFIFNAMNSVHQSAVTVAGQNLGAKKYIRVRKSLYTSIGLATIIGIVMCATFYLFNEELVRFYSNDPKAIKVALARINFFCSMYFICGIMDTITGFMRGLGRSVVPMIISLLGVCVFRIAWVFIVFPYWKTLTSLYFSYPISWLLSIVALLFYYHFWIRKDLLKDSYQ